MTKTFARDLRVGQTLVLDGEDHNVVRVATDQINGVVDVWWSECEDGWCSDCWNHLVFELNARLNVK